jgi:uncharacterized membrane protein (DUF4010 family)
MPDALSGLPLVQGIGAALAIGLLIGVERGWRERETPEGGRVAGLRTFALVGLLGGVLAAVPGDTGTWLLAAGLVGLALLLAVSYLEGQRSTGNLSITSAAAMLLTFALGILAVRGAPGVALAVAVVAAVLLNLKPTLHGWLRQIEHRELTAALQLLVLSVVILPLLPDDGYGPYRALNPYRLWWAVVLIAGLSLTGHLAMRLTGAQRGLLWTGLLGGLASSTAATLALSRHARRRPGLAGAAAAAILGACGVMYLRMIVLIASVQPLLLRELGPALGAAGALLIASAALQWRRLEAPALEAADAVEDVAPFDLSTALGFGVFLAAMAVLVPGTQQWLGDSGTYALAAVSGMADVDASLISLSRLQDAGGLPKHVAVVAIGITTFSNMVVKAVIAWIHGGAATARPVLPGYALAMLAFVVIAAWSAWA